MHKFNCTCLLLLQCMGVGNRDTMGVTSENYVFMLYL